MNWENMYSIKELLIGIQIIISILSIVLCGICLLINSNKYSEFIYSAYDDEYSYNRYLYGITSIFRFKFKYKEVRSKYYYYLLRSWAVVFFVGAFDYLLFATIKWSMIYFEI